MKTYKEVAESVFQRRDAYVARKNKRIAAIKKYTAAASCICILLVVCVGVWKADLFGFSPSLEKSGSIITETTSSSDERETQQGQSSTEENISPTQESSYNVQEDKAEETAPPLTGTASIQTSTALAQTSTTAAATALSTEENTKPSAVVTSTTASAQTGTAPAKTTTVPAQTSTTMTAAASATQTSTAAITESIDTNETPVTTTTTASASGDTEGALPETNTSITSLVTYTTSASAQTTTVTYAPMGSELSWEEKTIVQKFPKFYFGEENVLHLMSNARKKSSEIGEYLGTAEFEGYDTINMKTYTTKGRVFTLEGISPEYALAVRYQGDDTYYLARNTAYVPESLGDMITDMMLEGNITFGTVYERYGPQVLCGDPDDEVVWDMLLSDTSPVNEKYYGNSVDTGDRVLGITVNLPKLGRYGLTLAVTENGYITTNIVDKGAAFHIGKDKTEAFINYIKGESV